MPLALCAPDEQIIGRRSTRVLMDRARCRPALRDKEPGTNLDRFENSARASSEAHGADLRRPPSHSTNDAGDRLVMKRDVVIAERQ